MARKLEALQLEKQQEEQTRNVLQLERVRQWGASVGRTAARLPTLPGSGVAQPTRRAEWLALSRIAQGHWAGRGSGRAL